MRIGLRLIAFALAIVAAVLFGSFILLGAWIDGRRQAVRNKGLHPVTTPEGQVEAREFETLEAAKDSTARDSRSGEQERQ